MTNRTKINLLIRLITLTTGLVIGGGVSASVIEVNAETSPVIGHAPEVKDVKFDNTTPALGETVTATPIITDADNDTLETPLYQWQLNGVDITGATDNNYTPAYGQGNGQLLTVVVTPRTDPRISQPAIGMPFKSSPIITQGVPPKITRAIPIGNGSVGYVINPDYDYYDGDYPQDREDTSINGTRFEWIQTCDGKEQVVGANRTYTIKEEDRGCNISYNITPYSISGTPHIGSKVKSNWSIPVSHW